MNKTFDGHTPNENSLLDLDRSNTHIYNIDAKRCKVDNDSATYLWQCRLGHIGQKRVKKPKVEPKPETKCFCNKGNSHWSRITLDTW